MLQCSKYKAASAPKSRQTAFHDESIHATFTKRAGFAPRKAGADVIGDMGHSAISGDLRNMMSVAIKLRQLAAETVPQDDRKLYLTAASALEDRANTMATTRPGAHYARDTGGADPHRPVDMKV
jgi:hypothetical protein